MGQRFDSTISKFVLALRRNDSDLGRNQAIMFNAPVAGKIEHGFLAKPRRIEIAIVDKKLIVLRLCFRDDLTIWVDDHAASYAMMAVLDAAFGHRHYPGRVLIGAGLQRKLVVEHALCEPFVAVLRVDRGRVETEHHHLDALQPEHAKSLRPPPVVADAHPEHAVQQAPCRKANIAGLEIALFEMLVTALRIEFIVARQMDLAVLADDDASLVDQYRSVEVMSIRREFRIAETHSYGGALRLLKQGPRGSAWHLALEPDVSFAAVLPVPAWEECGQGQLRIDDNIAAFSPPHKIEHASNHGLTAVCLLDRAKLSGGHLDVAHPIAP